MSVLGRLFLGLSCLLAVLPMAAAVRSEEVQDSSNGVEASSNIVRVAAISFVPVKLDLAGNADRLECAFRRAQEGGAQIAVAPEGILDGYVVNEIIAGTVPAESMKEVAIPIDGAMMDRFQELAAELEMCLAFGFAERVDEDVYNCAVFIDSEGEIRGKYHKMQLAEGYDPSWWFNRMGKSSRAFDTPFGRCGFLICNDRWNDDLARIPVLDGAQFLLIPSFGSCSPEQDEAVLSRGVENGVPIVEANVGVTLIVSDGRIAAVDRNEEGITFGEIAIPAPSGVLAEDRDELEREFLDWRAEEMPRRLEQRLQQLEEASRAGEPD